MSRRLLLGLALVAVPPALWADDPKPVHILRPPGHVTWVAFTPDSKHLLSANWAEPRVVDEAKCELRLWAVATGKSAAGPATGPGVIASGAVSPDGKVAVTGGTAGVWRTWRLPDLTPVAAGKVGEHRVHRLAFRPDGTAFTALHADYGDEGAVAYTAVTIHLTTEKPIRAGADWPAERPPDVPADQRQTGPPAEWTLGNDPPFDADGLPVRPEGREVEPLAVPGNHPRGWVMARAISRDRKRAVSAGSSEVVVWDYPARKVVGEPLARYDPNDVMDPGLAISADGRRAAVARLSNHGGADHKLKLTVYDLDTRAAVVGPVDLGGLGSGLIDALAFSPDGSVVAIAFDRIALSDGKRTAEVQLWRVPAEK
jgi:WD40 repeat protein